jgi:hypothetical protein
MDPEDASHAHKRGDVARGCPGREGNGGSLELQTPNFPGLQSAHTATCTRRARASLNMVLISAPWALESGVFGYQISCSESSHHLDPLPLSLFLNPQ